MEISVLTVYFSEEICYTDFPIFFVIFGDGELSGSFYH